MKRVLFAFLVFAGACAPVPPGDTGPTQTPFIVYPTPAITVAPTATPIIVSPTPTATPEERYIVQPGDTLSGIAQRFGLEVSFLAWLNNIANPDRIYPGQEIKLVGEVEVPTASVASGREIVVKLSSQRLFAYEDGKLIATFIVSTGTTAYPTRVGKFAIRIKLASDRMTGPGYDLSGVPWVMYFDGDRGFHGKYWNEIYGRPSSHGCVNMMIEDAKWLYDWAEAGDVVTVVE